MPISGAVDSRRIQQIMLCCWEELRPEVAQTLVGLGVNLSETVTRGILQSGLAFANTQYAR